MLCGLMCQQVSVLPPGCRPATAAEGQSCDGAETPTGYESLPPTTSLSAFVPLSRTIMSPAWLCRRPRMVGTGRGGAAGGCTRWECVGGAWLGPLQPGSNAAGPSGTGALGILEGQM